MSVTQSLTLLATLLVSGGFASYLVEKIKRSAWSARSRYLLALALSAGVGLAGAWLAGDVLGLLSAWGALSASQVLAFCGGVYASAHGFYVLYFRSRAARG